MLGDADWLLVDIPRFTEPTGALSVVEIGAHFDFPVRRVFWVSDVISPQAIRGEHAHGPLRQLIFCPTGSCTIALETRNGETARFVLASGGQALLLNGAVWRSMTDFTPDCCMMVLCDREYAQDEVIEDYQEFRRS
jgi:hypothetical protein